MEDPEISREARKAALLNAIEHGGKADLGSVVGRLMSENAELRKFAKGVRELAQVSVSAVNAIPIEKQASIFESEFPGELEKTVARKKQISKLDSEKVPALSELPDIVRGAFVSRFPPEPNGYMHIGHAKAAILGHEYARRYDGAFLVRFDDTNPVAEKKEYYGAFLESLEWLKIKPDRVKNASDDMALFYKLAEQLIGNSRAYVCKCEQDEMRRKRAQGLACPHRSQTIEQNLLLWKEMLSGVGEKGSSTLRFVGDMQSLNTAMRDPVLFRIVQHPHPIKGNQYRVWPTYDFDGAVEDSVDGVTHALRSKEYELRDEPYYAILDALALRKPRIIEFSRLDLQNTTVSKRNLKKLIEEGNVMGWDDPRLPTIAGLKRRGFLPETIREFVLSMGLSKVESQPTWDLLESINRKLLDPMARRFFFVPKPVELKVEDAPELKVHLKFHPDKNLGERQIETEGMFLVSSEDAKSFTPGIKVRLMEAYNIEIISIGRTTVARMCAEEKLDKIRRIHWVVPGHSYPLSVMVTGPLLIDEKYNPASLETVEGLVEEEAKDIKLGDIVQFVRFGFCRLDSPGMAIMAHK
jgi:glutamyl-tRNA synthetase